MLLARAPVRVSLAGGGTDLPSYYERRGGLVVSATINKFFYVFISPTGGDGVHISSSDFSTFSRWSGREAQWDGHLRLPRAVLHEFGVEGGFSIFLASEIPPGTGLGSSSAVTVALTKAISTYLGQRLPASEIAERAARIEIDKLGSPIGRQDQYASAFGGLNAITFEASGVRVEPLVLSPERRTRLESSLLLFYTGQSRSEQSALQAQRRSTERGQEEVLRSLDAIKSFAEETRRALEREDVDAVGEILHRSWQTKRGLARGVTNDRIDALYELAREHGALGGKIAGGGGGGFLLLYCPPTKQRAVREALEAEGLHHMDFSLHDGGARVLVNAAVRPVPGTHDGLREAA